MVNSLQQAQQALHVSTPLVQHIISISWLGEVNDASWAIDLGEDGLCGNQFADILLSLLLSQVEKLSQAWNLDTSIVLGNDSNIVLNDTLSEIFPSLIGLLVCRLIWSNIEDIGSAEVWTKDLSNFRPPHEFVDCEELEELGIESYLGVSGVSVNAMEEVGLFVVIWSENDIVDDSLEDLGTLAFGSRKSIPAYGLEF